MAWEYPHLSCWKCGAGLDPVPRPFSRFAQCPSCKAELHVCRLCIHYDPRYVGACNHDFADKVLEKGKANFCAHFRPSSQAFAGDRGPEKVQAQQELNALFGSCPELTRATNADDEPANERDGARQRLQDLFDD